MSTKSTVAHGPDFHLYREIFDEDNVYLEVERAHFEASPHRVSVAIPLAVWEFARRFAVIDLNRAQQSDEELQREAETLVDERIRAYEQAETPRKKAIVSGCGALSYGGADEPREVQRARVKGHLEEERARQRAVKDALDALEQLNQK